MLRYVERQHGNWSAIQQAEVDVSLVQPDYIIEGKNQLVIAIGCTGGKHRSVTLANALYHTLETEESYGVRIEHRDIGKDSITKRK